MVRNALFAISGQKLTQEQTGSKSDGPLHRKRTAGTDVDAEDEANAKQARLDATDNSSIYSH